METFTLFVSRLSPSTTEFDIRQKFPRATIVVIARDRVGRSRLYARMVFRNLTDLNDALLLNGTKLMDRTIILSLLNRGVKIPVYLKFANVPPHATKSHLLDHFKDFCVGGRFPNVILTNRAEGFGFVYLFCHEDYLNCLAHDGEELLGKPLHLTPGSFLGTGSHCERDAAAAAGVVATNV